MADLSLDLSAASGTYGDLVYTNGNLVMTSDYDPAGSQAILQDVLTRLRTYLGEWFMDGTIGVPWFQQVFVKNPDMTAINTTIRNEILATPGITGLTSFSSSANTAKRILTISFTASTDDGQVSYTGSL